VPHVPVADASRLNECCAGLSWRLFCLQELLSSCARCGSSATSCGPLPRSAATPRNSRPTHRLGAASHPPLYHCNTLRKRAVMRCAAEPPVLPPPPCPNAWPAPADVHASQRLKPFCAQAAELPAICAELHARLAGHEAKRRFAPN
jgi:hypothetical protein